MFIVVVVFENFGGDGYSLPMRKSVSFFCGLGGQMTLALEDNNEAKNKSDLTRT